MLATTSCLREKALVYHLVEAEDDYYPYYFLKGRSGEVRCPNDHLVDPFAARMIIEAVEKKTQLIGPTFKSQMTHYLLKRYPSLDLQLDADDKLKPWTTDKKLSDLRNICDVGIGFLFEGSHYGSLLTSVFPNWRDFQASELYSSQFQPTLQSLIKIMHRSGLTETTVLKNELIDILAKFFLKGNSGSVSRSDWISSQLKKLCPPSVLVT